jgi:Domain of unknown function (DUF4189)
LIEIATQPLSEGVFEFRVRHSGALASPREIGIQKTLLNLHLDSGPTRQREHPGMTEEGVQGTAMTDSFTSVMRALVVAALLLATAMLMLVSVKTARAAGALAIGTCGAFGEAYDFHSAAEAKQSALAKCAGRACRVVTTIKHGCAAFAVDFTNPCGAHGWGKGPRLGRTQNQALRSCYHDGGKECVIRTFFCDAKG